MRLMMCSALGAVAGVSLATAAQAAVTIDFDSLPNATVLTAQYQGMGVVFSSADGGRAEVSVGTPFTNPVSGPGSVYFYNNITFLPTTIRATFVNPDGSQALADFAAFTPTDSNVPNTLCFMKAYSLGGVLLDSDSGIQNGEGNYNPATDPELSVSAPAIAYIEFTVDALSGGGSVIEGDNLRFNLVPAPAGAGVLGAGLILASRRRRSGGALA